MVFEHDFNFEITGKYYHYVILKYNYLTSCKHVKGLDMFARCLVVVFGDDVVIVFMLTPADIKQHLDQHI